MNELLLVQASSEGVRTLTLNRPRAMNSLTVELLQALVQAFDNAAADASVRCVVLTGEGRAFCAGQDLGDPSVAPGSDLGTVVRDYYGPLVNRIRNLPIPVVAAVNGVAAGAGANLALCCDVVVAARSASFIQAFSKIGLVPDTGGTWLLPRLVGQARAMGLALFGDKLLAADAVDAGLIWQCVDDDMLAPTAHAMAQRLAGMPVKALVTTRLAMTDAQNMTFEEAVANEAKQQTFLGYSHDFNEGVTAFRDKRAPVFTDR